MGVLGFKKPLVVSAYECSGKNWIMKNKDDSYFLDENLEIIILRTADFKYEERLPTKEEVLEYDMKNKHKNTLIGQDYFVKRFEQTKHTYTNYDYPENYIKEIQDSTADIILVDSDNKTRKVLTDANIDFVTVYPKIFLKNEWIGRSYLNNRCPEILAMKWESDITKIEKQPHGKRIFWLDRQSLFLEEIMPVIIKYWKSIQDED